MELSEQEIVRRQSLQTMRDLGIDPYPAAEYEVTGFSTDIKSHFVDNDEMSEAWLLNDVMMKGTVIHVRNKADLLRNERVKELKNEGLLISAKNGEIEPLKQELVRIAKESMQTSAVMLSNARHYEAISRAHEAIVRVQDGLRDGLSGELLSMDLQDCLNALGEVTGQITNQEVLANIFSKFCIGK